MSDPRAAFRYPAFRRLQAAKVLGVLAIQMVSVAVGWQVYDRTGRPLDLGLVGLVQFLPHLLLFPLTGLVVDRYERKRVYLACFAGLTLGVLLLAVASRGQLPLGGIYALLVLISTARAFSAPTQSALLPQTVPHELFGNAVTWSSSIWSTAAIAGPALGGAVALLPVYAKDILHAGPVALGFLRAAPSVGAATMAVFLSYRPIHRQAGRKLLVAVAVFGVATVWFALSSSFVPCFLALVLAGLADEVSVVIRSNITQMSTPESLRGRVSAAEFVFIGVSNEIGELESGVVAQLVGPVWAALSGGIGSLCVVAWTALFAPAVRGIDRLTREELGVEPPSGGRP